MGIQKYTFNAITGEFDLIEQDIVVVSSAPTSGSEGVFYQVSGDPAKTYYFSGGNRYRIDATIDNPAASGSVWLSLGLSLMP